MKSRERIGFPRKKETCGRGVFQKVRKLVYEFSQFGLQTLVKPTYFKVGFRRVC